MNKQESLALYTQGKNAWNAWATELLSERDALKAAGFWVESQSRDNWNDETRAWQIAAKADFSGHDFQQPVNFADFVFPGDAGFDAAIFISLAAFNGARFLGRAEFGRAEFGGPAQFRKAKFEGRAGFDRAKFESDAQFAGAKFGGDAWFYGAKFGTDARFAGARFGGHARFDQVTFEGEAQFDPANIKGHAQFAGTKFGSHARFGGAKFGGNASFDRAKFGAAAWFAGVTFRERTRFAEVAFTDSADFDVAKFEGEAKFDAATFTGRAKFRQTAFAGYTAFQNAKFEKAADLVAMQGGSAFSLAGAKFLEVPDFEQAHFAEAPRLDNLSIEPAHSRRFTGDADLAARWRALKRLAIQGHDHARELMFFRGEIRAGRWAKGNFWPTIFSYPYQWFSGFGRSLFLPLIWWGLSIPIFADLYLGQHLSLTKQGISGLGWAIRRFAGIGGDALSLTCIEGPEMDPWWAAVSISLHKGIPFLGGAASGRLQQAYVCLYGAYGFGSASDIASSSIHPGTLSPLIPNCVDILSLVQLVISSVLIFLFLLAVRNHFRIK